MQDIDAFRSQARSVMEREGRGKRAGKPLAEWESRIKHLRTTKNYTDAQAAVQASKYYPMLHGLFAEYDVASFDPEPGSHPAVAKLLIDREKQRAKAREDLERLAAVQTDDVPQTHRANLAWALAAAGRFLRTGAKPERCPNDSAYYLYCRAIETPKEFLTKVNQLESSAKATKDESRVATQRSIHELSNMIAGLKRSPDLSPISVPDVPTAPTEFGKERDAPPAA